MRASVLKRLMEIKDEHLRGVLVDVVEEIERDLATKEMLEAFVQRTDENFKRVWDAIHELAEAQKRTEQQIGELAAAQKQTEERLDRLEKVVEELAEAQKRTEEHVSRLEKVVEELAEAQKRTEEELRSLTREVAELKTAFWGEKGRMEGERYERRIVQSARRILGRGRGGSPSTLEVQRMLDEMLGDLDVSALASEEDPYLADLIWAKNGVVLVVEISLVVDRRDVERVWRRAETLRQAGVEARPVVIGERWAAEDTRNLAQEKGVAWYVEQAFSPELIELRKRA